MVWLICFDVCSCVCSTIRAAPHLLPADFSELLDLCLWVGGLQHGAEGPGQPLST